MVFVRKEGVRCGGDGCVWWSKATSAYIIQIGQIILE